MKFLLTIALPITFASANAQAAGTPASPYSPQYYACVKKAGSPGFYDQSASASCDEAEVKFQKKRINAAYDKLSKMWSTDPDRLAKLNVAQKAWVRWRNETYALLQEAGGSNGQVVYIVSSGFLLKSLVDQADLLESLVAANGG